MEKGKEADGKDDSEGDNTEGNRSRKMVDGRRKGKGARKGGRGKKAEGCLKILTRTLERTEAVTAGHEGRERGGGGR